ncbi:MAG: hypothetical protein IJY55_04710 [Clostridia bacterium]|nr:hypothetical protein [Clostridia bacterium]
MIKLYDQNVWNVLPIDNRSVLVRSMVEQFDADFCAFQECGPNTSRTGETPLPVLMSDKYAEVCPEKAGVNYTPVFYKKEKYNVLEADYHVYTGFNDVNSKTLTWGVFEDKETGEKIAIGSTHFWFKNESEIDNQQRIQNANELKEACDYIVAKYDIPVIVSGDFNNGRNAETGDAPYHYMIEQGFKDIRHIAEETTDGFTYHDYPVLDEEKGIYVNRPDALPFCDFDFIFIYGPDKIKAKKFEILTSEKALNSSDHCPLLGVFEIIK